jgi:DNA-binding NtrC family response regulator
MRLLAAFWPGNVRQLRNEMRRLILMGEGEISPEDFDEGIFINHTQGTANEGGLDALIERVEKKAIAEALQKHAFNITKTAASLHVTRYVLQRKVQKYGLKEDS